jgi:hypothetical protein
MGRVPYSEFVGSRARLQRLSDQQIFSAWVQELRSDCVVVTAEQTFSFASMERFLFQVQGPSADAYFIAGSTAKPMAAGTHVNGNTATMMVQLPSITYKFNLITQVQLRDAQQHARKAVGDLVAKLHACGRTSEVMVADASALGMGIIAWEELRKGDVVQVDLHSEALTATFMGEVRHCRPEPRLIGAYRVGLKFQNPDRISLTSWRKLINPI